MMTTRRFGIEIEGFGITIEQARVALHTAGVNVEYMGYTHHTHNFWKIVTDATVEDGWEVVSPILQGEEGLREAERVAKILDTAGAKVDKRCGFHVHVDAAGLSPDEIMSVVNRYSKFETEIDAFMPASRRNNGYCASMRGFTLPPCSGLEQFRTALRERGRWHGARYLKVNLQAFIRHGTIEFRQHSGTRNANKIRNWILFCLGFVEASREFCRMSTPVAPPPVPVSREVPLPAADLDGFWNLTRAQQNILVRLMSGPASVEALCQAGSASRNGYNGVTEQTLYSYISEIRQKCGVTIKKRRGGDYYILNMPTRTVTECPYYTAPVPVPVLPMVEDSLFTGIAPEVASYYEERIQDLAS